MMDEGDLDKLLLGIALASPTLPATALERAVGVADAADMTGVLAMLAARGDLPSEQVAALGGHRSSLVRAALAARAQPGELATADDRQLAALARTADPALLAQVTEVVVERGRIDAATARLLANPALPERALRLLLASLSSRAGAEALAPAEVAALAEVDVLDAQDGRERVRELWCELLPLPTLRRHGWEPFGGAATAGRWLTAWAGRPDADQLFAVALSYQLPWQVVLEVPAVYLDMVLSPFTLDVDHGPLALQTGDGTDSRLTVDRGEHPGPLSDGHLNIADHTHAGGWGLYLPAPLLQRYRHRLGSYLLTELPGGQAGWTLLLRSMAGGATPAQAMAAAVAEFGAD